MSSLMPLRRTSGSLLSSFNHRFFSSYALSYTWDRPFLTTNRFVLIQNPIDSNPYLQLSNDSKHIELKKELHLRDIEKQLL